MIRLWFYTMLACVSVIAALGTSVRTDYYGETNFAKYHTYKWLDEQRTQDQLVADRVIGDVDVELELKGLERDQIGGTLGVAAHVATKEDHSLEAFYGGMNGWSWSSPSGAANNVRTFNEGTLVVDLFDTATKQVIWRGTAANTISNNAEKDARNVQKAVRRMFKECPLGPEG